MMNDFEKCEDCKYLRYEKETNAYFCKLEIEGKECIKDKII